MELGLPGLFANLAGPVFLIVIVALVLSGKRRDRRTDGVPDGPEDEPYRVYTRQFDQEVRADHALGTIRTSSPDFSKAWLPEDDVLWDRWIERTHDLLDRQRFALAEQQFDAVHRLRLAAGEVELDKLVVALLVDQSGSMKGERIAWASVAATLLSETLTGLGVRSEILGFSTAGWHGGHAYSNWIKSGRPKRPGRLCALRHVIYKSADQSAIEEASLHAMVHPGLLRENVDGEALLWARERVGAWNASRRFIIVISDGAPVDDVTILHNGPSYLGRHHRTVLQSLREERDLIVSGLGISYRVDKFYPLSEWVSAPERLPEASIALLEKMFVAARDTTNVV